MMDEDIVPVVIDAGSGYVKCGFGGDEAPKSVFPSIVGRPHMPGAYVAMDAKDCYVGEEALYRHATLRMKRPIEHGMVTNWNDMEKIWHHTFYNELRVTPEEHSVVLTEVGYGPRNNREKMTSIMFETFNVMALHVGLILELSLFSTGRVNGFSIDCGSGVTIGIPIYEGYSLPHACFRMNLAGRDITEYLNRLLTEKGFSFSTCVELEVVRDIKEKLCYVSLDMDTDLIEAEAAVSETDCELPDGSKLVLGSERFRAPEILFDPSLCGSEITNLPKNTINSILKCDADIRRNLFRNILISGGSSMFQGFPERLETELQKERSDAPIVLTASEDRKYAVWKGASVLSSIDAFRSRWTTKDEYDEFGPTIMHRK